MTVLRVNATVIHQDNDKTDEDGWYFVTTDAGVNVSWSSPPQGESVCIPHGIWGVISDGVLDRIAEYIGMEDEPPPASEAEVTVKKRRRRKPTNKIELS